MSFIGVDWVRVNKLMAKTTQPLRIVVLEPFLQEKWVEDLKAKGHEVLCVHPDLTWLHGAHLILGPQAHFFHPSMRVKDLEEALKWARKQVYPSRKGGKKKNGEAQ